MLPENDLNNELKKINHKLRIITIHDILFAVVFLLIGHLMQK